MRTIELRTAYVYDCEDCGKESFVRSIDAPLSDEEREEVSEYGGDPRGEWVMIPDRVTCPHCGATFNTVDSRATDEAE